MSGAQIPHGFILRLDTRNFAFEAHGLTEEQAIETMGRLLAAHGLNYGLRPDWSDEYLDSFNTTIFKPGAGLCDGAEIGPHRHDYSWTGRSGGPGIAIQRCKCGDEIEKDVS